MDIKYLTTGEFERWCREDREFKRDMRRDMKSLTEKDANHGERIRGLETDMVNVKPTAKTTSIKWGAGVTTLLTIVLQAAFAAFGFGGHK
jgi:hypothetical protein